MTDPKDERAPEPRTVLVVEDEVLIRLMISEALRDAGLRVVEVGNAEQAVAYLRTDPEVRLVFSDVRMPGPMDGVELAGIIVREFPHTKVVLASGQLSPGRNLNGALFFQKPYRVEAMAARIVDLVQRAG